MIRNGLFLIMILTLTGCGAQIKDFVGGGAAQPQAPPIGTIGLNSSKTLKISPGHADSTGPHVGASLTLTPTHRAVKGAHVDATVSFHQSRTE